MMALSLARLSAAGLIAGAAGLAGLVMAPARAPAPAPAPSSVVGGPGPVLQSDISALSARLRATGLFPAATALQGSDVNDADLAARQDEGGAQGAEGAGAPPITALVREDRVWRLHAGGVINGRERLIEGDELYDGWWVAEIGATHIVLRRADETRAIHFFESPGDD